MALSFWNMPPAIREEQIHWKKTGQYKQDLAWLKQPQVITLPLPACTVGTRHEWCITSSASLLTLTCPSLWNRWNEIWTHQTSDPYCSGVQYLCTLADWGLFFQLASLISSFHKATQVGTELQLKVSAALANAKEELEYLQILDNDKAINRQLYYTNCIALH